MPHSRLRPRQRPPRRRAQRRLHLVKETGALKTILIATGTEVQHAVDAAEAARRRRPRRLHALLRALRPPAAGLPRRSPPAACTKRIAIEAGVTGLWWKYVGLDGKVIGIDRFGISAPGNTVMKELGMTAEAVVDAAK